MFRGLLQFQVFSIDIHPGAKLGTGIFIDHGTGVTIGETAVVGDNVSMLHKVTLGGSGTRNVLRHPNIGNGVLLGAGSTLLGNIKIGDGANIGACSMVLEDIPEGSVAVGVPAKVIKRPPSAKRAEGVNSAPAALEMNTNLLYDYEI
jgi:serine O-acetyltransferase